MKKNLFFSLFILCFLLSSCELLELLLDDSGYSGGNYKYKETLVDVPISGNDDESTKPDSQVDYEITSDSQKTVYLVKLNNSDDIINKNHTGYVKSIKYRNAAENPVCNTDNFIRKLNEELSIISMQQAQRSAASDYIVENYSSKTYTKGQTETFWSYVDIKNKDTSYEEYVPGQVNATCKYAGDYCYVFADDSDSRKSSKGINLSSNDYVALGKKFDECYKLETGILGNPLYKKYHSYYFVPCNQKVIILVSDLFGDAQLKQDGGTVGYFYNGDLYTENYINQIYGNKYHTNKCEMFYIDSLFFTSRKDTVYSTLIHEFNHMINYVVKTINDLTENPEATSFNSCDVWYTEMLAMVTEDLFQKKLGIDDEHSPKGRLPLFNMYYNYGYRLWNTDGIEQTVMYANTYAFGAYLVRNFGGKKLLSAIAKNKYVNEDSITAALRECNPDYTYIDDETQEERRIDYEYAMRNFCMCLFNTDKPSEEQLKKTGKNQYFSFYRQAGSSSEELYFSPIDIMNIECDVQDETGRIVHRKVEPAILKYNEIMGIGPSGFTVHEIGQNIKSFQLMASNKDGLEYYLITVTQNK